MATFGLNLTVGYAGQMSLGQAAFFGIGAYIAAIVPQGRAAVPGRAAARRDRVLRRRPRARLSGAARAAPLPRVRHARLQRAGVPGDAQRGEAHRRHVRHLRHSAPVAVRRVARRRARRSSASRWPRRSCSSALLWWLLRSPWGRAFAALRDNPIRAESLGVNITAYTLLAFAIGAACAGIGGVLLRVAGAVHRAGAVPRLDVADDAAGGDRRRLGPLLRAGARHGRHRRCCREWLRFMQNWYLAVFGFAVVALMVWLPGGLLSHPASELRRRASGAMSTPFLEVEGRAQAVRRDQGRRRRHVQRRTRRDRRRDRPQRQRQDDAVQQHPRADQADVRAASTFCGEDITGMSPLELSRRGVGRTFQTLQVFVQAVGARQPDRRGAGVQGHAAAAPVRAARRRARRARRRDDRAVPPAARRAPAGRHAVVRPAEADRHRDGVHAGAAPGAARRAVRRRQSEPGRPAARAAASSSTARRAAASS